MARTVNTELAFIDDIILDCLVSEEHSYDAEISEFPTESGATITDNIRSKNCVLNVQAIVSNTPIRDTSGDPMRTGAPADDAFARLMKIRADKRLVPVRTSLKTYDSMALKNLTVNRTAQNADALEFTAVFQQVQVVKNDRSTRVAIPAAKKRKVVTKPPAPAPAQGPKPNFNDSLPLYKVFRKDGDWLWYDETIGGWRLSAVHDAPAQHSNQFLPGSSGRPVDAAGEGWVVYRSRPYGVSSQEWNSAARKTDEQYREDIERAYEISKDGGGPLNKYDPFMDFGLGSAEQRNGTDTDIRIVHAMRR